MTVLVTGGAGFIGSHFVLDWLEHEGEPVVDLDALTYAGHLRNLEPLRGDARHVFVHGDIAERALVDRLLAQHRPRAIVHLAAESHVDRSLHGPAAFVRTNVEGTFTLLEAARAYWATLPERERAAFRFLHVSTDEVYGRLGPDDRPFYESSGYAPGSPYAASKAAADHLVRAWHHTWGLPVIVTNACNNYGPRQFPEKLIPLVIVQALAGQPLPVYGDGRHSRDWLYVRDHCRALREVLARGRIGETYHVGARCERSTLQVVHAVCALLDEMRPDPAGPYGRLVQPVADRPGHERRLALDPGRIERELGWRPAESFESGSRATVRWYLEHPQWTAEVRSGAYRDWLASHYGRS